MLRSARWIALIFLIAGAAAGQAAPSHMAPGMQGPADSEAEAPKVWVFFGDKGVVAEADFAAARAALDDHAVARRSKTIGEGLVDFYDLPVCAGYLQDLRERGAEICRVSRWLNAASVRAPHALLQEIAGMPAVRAIRPVARGRVHRPAPPESSVRPTALAGGRDLFDYGPSHDQMEEIGIVAAHEAGFSGAGVRITVTDTGFWRDHPTFQRLLDEGRLLAQWDFINNDGETMDEPGDPEWQQFHGTAVWSLIGAFTEGEIVGAAYGADFLLAKTEDTSLEDPIEEDNWVAAMEWADSLGTDIISVSLNYIDWYQYSDMDGDTALITIAADIAASRGIAVCVAAGNYATMDWYYIGAPADGDSVIAVGATEPDGSMWFDSSHGPTYDGRTKPEVVARGSLTYCAVVPGQHGNPAYYREQDGTSVACPLVAGAAALLLEAHPGWTAMMVREALMMTADNAATPDNHRGWGRIDVMAALSYFSSGVAAQMPPAAITLSAAPNPFRGETQLTWQAPRPATLEILSPTGALLRRFAASAGYRTIAWDGRDADGRRLAPGIYLARLLAGSQKASGKLIFLR